MRLRARPGKAGDSSQPGLYPLDLRPNRDALLYIPPSLSAAAPAPLVVYLHGAGGVEQHGIKALTSFADNLRFLLLSPSSQGGTWDAILGDYGHDVRFIDRALTRAFSMREVDPGRIALSGFSDGASYALGLGLSNGHLFRSILAFSPGFIPAGSGWSGKPRIFDSHGTADTVLPIDRCSRRIVPALKRIGYDVTYREFNGPHIMPPNVTREALDWFLG